MWIHIGLSFAALAILAGYLFYNHAWDAVDLAKNKKDLDSFTKRNLWMILLYWILGGIGVTAVNFVVIWALETLGKTMVVAIVVSAVVGAGLLKVIQIIFKKKNE